MVYDGNNLSYILHPFGLIRKSSLGFVYDYFLKDHLGSTRVMLESGGNARSHSTVWNFVSALTPVSVLVTGIVNHKHYTWVNEIPNKCFDYENFDNGDLDEYIAL